jgi:ribosomal protein S7
VWDVYQQAFDELDVNLYKDETELFKDAQEFYTPEYVKFVYDYAGSILKYAHYHVDTEISAKRAINIALDYYTYNDFKGDVYVESNEE